MNAVLARNVVLGADWTYSHAAHLLVLAGPDYKLYGLLTALQQSVVVNNYADLLHWVIIPAQQYMHQIITLWGGKAPHQRASVPGGNPVRPTAEVIEQTRMRINQFRAILDVAAPIVWNYLTSNAVQLSPWALEPAISFRWESFPDPTTSAGTGNMPLTIPRGFISYPNTTPESFDPANMTEDISQVLVWWWSADRLSTNWRTNPLPDMSISGAYTWAKSPRYKGLATESGPLAREYVSGIYPALGKVINSIIPAVPGLPLNPKGSVFDRMVARAVELVALVGSNNTTKNLEVLGQPLNLSLVDVLNALSLPQAGLMDSLAPRDGGGR